MRVIVPAATESVRIWFADDRIQIALDEEVEEWEGSQTFSLQPVTPRPKRVRLFRVGPPVMVVALALCVAGGIGFKTLILDDGHTSHQSTPALQQEAYAREIEAPHIPDAPPDARPAMLTPSAPLPPPVLPPQQQQGQATGSPNAAFGLN